MEEEKTITTAEELQTTAEVTAEEKKYEFRKLGASDLFTMVSIISKIGVNKFTNCLKSEGVQDLVKDLADKKTINTADISLIAGGGVLFEVVQIILEGMPKCENEIYILLSNTSNLSLEEVKALDAVTFFEMITDFVKKEEFMDFIKAASKFVTKAN